MFVWNVFVVGEEVVLCGLMSIVYENVGVCGYVSYIVDYVIGVVDMSK